MPCTITVPYKEQAGSPLVKFEEGKGTGTRIFVVDWAQRGVALADLMGYTILVGKSLVRTAPDRMPGFPWLWCLGCEIRGKGKPILNPQGDCDWDKALLTASYRTLTWDPQQGPQQFVYMTESLKTDGKFQTISGRTFIFDDGSNTPLADATVGVLLHESEYTQTWHQVISPDFDLINSLTDCVNSQDFMQVGIFQSIRKGAMLFEGCEATRDNTSKGVSCWKLTYKFKVQGYDFNKIFKPSSTDGTALGKFVLVKDQFASPLKRIYPYADLTQLWY